MGMDVSAALIMVMVHTGFAGMNIFSKLAFNAGMDPFVHVAYRQIFASIVALPLAYFLEREKRPPMTNRIFIKLLFSSTIGMTVNQMSYFVGLKHTTPTIACALSNILPALTFILAVLLRQESVRWKTLVGQTKIMGTLASVGGAMVLSLYHGPVIPIGESGVYVTVTNKMQHSNESGQGNLLGPCLIILTAFTMAIWLVLQANMFDKYPAPYSTSAIMVSMAAIQSCILGLIVEPRLQGWSLFPPIKAISCVYAGIVCSVIALFMISWCVERRGPLFVSVFNPLQMIIVAVLSWGLLREKLYLGTVVGSLLIVGGLYCVLWGKSKDVETKGKNGITDLQPQEEKQKERKDLERR